MNIVQSFFSYLQGSIFGQNPLDVIADSQALIVKTQAKAEGIVSLAALDIEDAVDFQIENIRQTVASSFASITALLATGAVHADSAKVLVQAQNDIAKVLDVVDAAF
jgi:hypothetical protein